MVSMLEYNCGRISKTNAVRITSRTISLTTIAAILANFPLMWAFLILGEEKSFSSARVSGRSR